MFRKKIGQIGTHTNGYKGRDIEKKYINTPAAEGEASALGAKGKAV
jgi:hypothetical protein